jgi:uncharacterized NAD(P)/FAD-binding protein YdhS
MKRRRIAIVGAGFSGAALAAHLLRRGKDAPEVVLIDRSGRFGPGLAYGAREPAHLLNVRASNMSISDSEPDDFVLWLARKKTGEPQTFAQRRQYGAYIQDALRRAANTHWFGARLMRVRGEVESLHMPAEGAELRLRSGRVIKADAAVLALGNPPSPALPVFEQAGVRTIDAWDVNALKRIPAGADVLLVGSGLTMVDVALLLDTPKRTGAIYALSRRGLLSRSHAGGAAKERPPLPLPLPLSEALHEFRREVKAMAEQGAPWQHAFERIRKDTPALWRRLPLSAQQRFLRHLRPWWDVHRHRAAPEVAARIAALQESGKLRLLAGEIAGVTRSGRMISISHRQRGSMVRHKFDVSHVVNCTGANLHGATGLAASLEAAGVARPAANGLGFDVDEMGRLIDAAGVTLANLYAIGPVTQGTFWECTAVPEIRARAAALSQILMQHS